VAAPKEKETKHSHLFPFIFKKNADLQVARRLTCYVLLLDHFVLISVAPTQNEAKQSHTVLVSIDDSHHNLFVSSDFSDMSISSFPNPISSSFDTLPTNFQCPMIRVLETLRKKK
jgi:hypothetical protein